MLVALVAWRLVPVALLVTVQTPPWLVRLLPLLLLVAARPVVEQRAQGAALAALLLRLALPLVLLLLLPLPVPQLVPVPVQPVLLRMVALALRLVVLLALAVPLGRV